MCGICGFVERTPHSDRETLAARVDRMAATLRHRGPDDGGHWVDPTHGVALGHRRLAIVDLSQAGAQPMGSSCGRFVLSYNGEIYGNPELRMRLEATGRRFRGHSDTETLVEAISAWGVETALGRAAGMFAFALWDRDTGTLTLARDRVGKKPLYYGEQHGIFFFASELKALQAHAAFTPEVDRNALAFFVKHSYVPAPDSIYQGMHKLRAGEIVTLRPGQAPEKQSWWSAERVWSTGAASRFDFGEKEGIDSLGTLLEDAVEKRLGADVPLGALLSGGIDSSLVAALMKKTCPRPVRTFSIAFREAEYNEAPYAREVAAYLGTEHTELLATPEAAREIISELPTLYDEPFADTSQIPTALASRLAREHVTVALSGDGGDELFGGYTRYFRAADRWRQLARVPDALRRFCAGALDAWGASRFDRAAGLLRSGDVRDVFVQLGTRCPDAARFVVGAAGVRRLVETVGAPPEIADPAEWMMFVDFAGRLGNSMLTKVDRASMGVGLEIRCPLLDHRVVEWACRAPLEWKIRAGEGKWILRRLLEREVPKALFDRPKMGFGVPIGDWLRGPLRDWAESLLEERRLGAEGFLHPKAVREIWDEHQRGKRDRRFLLWNLLMFQAWLERDRS